MSKFAYTLSKDEWTAQREKALIKVLKRKNLEHRKVHLANYLATNPHASVTNPLQYLESKLNCCGFWWGTYHEGKPHTEN